MGIANIAGVGATQFAVGLSQVVRIVPTASQYAQSIKIIAGGGTLEVVPIQLSGASTAAGNAWGKGYPLGATEVFNMGGPAVFYLAATGATMTVGMAIGFTDGVTLF